MISKYLKIILTIVTILSLLSGIGLAWYANFKSNEADRYESNYKASLVKIKQYKDKNGLLVSETYELRLTIDEIKNSKDSTIRSMGESLEDMGIKLKRTENMAQITTKSTGKGTVKIDTVFVGNQEIKPMIRKAYINDGFLDMVINIDDDSLHYDYLNRDTIFIAGYKERRMETKKGKKRFFLARWVNPDWQYKLAAKSLNKNTIITSIKDVRIERRKGLSRNK